MRIVHRPISADSHFFVDQPPCRSLQRGMFLRDTRFGERDEYDSWVPDGRKTRLYAEVLRIIDKQSATIFSRFSVKRILSRVAEDTQRNQAVEHRRMNSG